MESNYWINPGEASWPATAVGSALRLLDDHRILSVGATPDGRLALEEGCDSYFRIALSKDEARKLVAELSVIVEALP